MQCCFILKKWNLTSNNTKIFCLDTNQYKQYQSVCSIAITANVTRPVSIMQNSRSPAYSLSLGAQVQENLPFGAQQQQATRLAWQMISYFIDQSTIQLWIINSTSFQTHHSSWAINSRPNRPNPSGENDKRRDSRILGANHDMRKILVYH